MTRFVSLLCCLALGSCALSATQRRSVRKTSRTVFAWLARAVVETVKASAVAAVDEAVRGD